MQLLLAAPLARCIFVTCRRPGIIGRAPCRQRHQRQHQHACVTRAGLKAVESFDGSFMLDTAAQEVLYKLLHSNTFCQQVAQQCNLPEGTQVEFTELLFQPVPWSPATKRGMPAEYEKYLEDPQYAVINVPPNYMFQAKVFKPPRLCAIYKQVS